MPDARPARNMFAGILTYQTTHTGLKEEIVKVTLGGCTALRPLALQLAEPQLGAHLQREGRQRGRHR